MPAQQLARPGTSARVARPKENPLALPSTSVPVRVVLLLTLLTLVWGVNWPMFRIALEEIPPWTFRTVTLALAVVALVAIARLRGLSLRPAPGRWMNLMLAALFNLTIWNMATAYAVLYMPSGHAAVIGFTMPLWAALIGYLFLRQRLPPRHIVALALGVVAVALLMARNFATIDTAPLGLALMVFAAICWALGTLVQKRTDWGMKLSVVTIWQIGLGLLPLLVVAAALEFPYLTMPGWQAIAIALFVGLISQAIGMSTWFAIVDLVPAHVAGISTISVPVVAVFSGAIVLGEPLGWMQWLALAAIVSALSLVLIAPAAQSKA